ncbi:GntR family transcriptional regulator [Alkaliphilus serpentinus]|uniref:GntR family transcriptional regulator n=1 Tax=Alkaliphilus serpentinus TaxID=1482731 RepID=A0A833M951_9FIRM|nr:GntR family transcriptional regulator [Alkaliphilus serpentinus]KAB3529076.1 GntR family transcriptional regulator [Alkaliphilus serpentinus]
MQVNFDSIKPIYVQIAEAIEDDIIAESLKEGEECYSQLIIARELNVNPATAAKGINLLVSEGILHKQRGLAMTVAEGARERILRKRKSEGFEVMVKELIFEANKLGITKDHIFEIINKYF